MNDPLVTVAIPIYNAEKTLAIAIKSVLLQTYKNWELFLINDGSTDDSLSIAKQFKDPRITLLNDNVNKGLIARLNMIPELSNGALIARMDSDDIMHPRRLEEQVKFMLANPSVDVSDCGIFTINENNKITGVRYADKLPLDKVDWIKHCYFTHPAVIGKREWFNKNRYNENFYRAEDYEIWVRTFDESKFGKLDQYLLFYREGNVNIKNYLSSIKSVNKVFYTYGKDVLPPATFYLSIVKNYLKASLYFIFGLFKMQRILVNFRSNMPSDSNIIEADAVITMIEESAIETT